MTRFEKHQNQIWAYLFDMCAIIAFIGVFAGHLHHLFTGAICLILARAFNYENQKS